MQIEKRLQDIIGKTGNIMIASFKGFSDAGNVSSSIMQHLIEQTKAVRVNAIDGDKFLDLRGSRPITVFRKDANGEKVVKKNLPNGEKIFERDLFFPGTIVFKTTLDVFGERRTVLLVDAFEPTNNWREFGKILVDYAIDQNVTHFFSLGSMLSDVPHTVDFRVLLTEHSGYGDPLPDKYEGTTSVPGFLNWLMDKYHIQAHSFWVPVPHYLVGEDLNSPKSAFFLLHALEKVFGWKNLTDAELEAEALKWTRSVSRKIETNEKLVDYVEELEIRNAQRDMMDFDAEKLNSEIEDFLNKKSNTTNNPTNE